MTDRIASIPSVTLKITPRRPALLAGHDNTLEVLVQVQAPAEAPQGHQRSPLSLALVLDRSGSMDGPPLREAVRCARAMIELLRPEDRVALVVYDNRVDTLVPAQTLHDRTPLYRALETVRAGGSTDLHGGWLRGAEELAAHTAPDTLSRVLLLSDGQANHGLVDLDEITSQCAQLAAAAVTTSTYGLGHGFNENLMEAMARAGQGQAYYGETADDLLEPFQREFDLLDALCAKRLRLGLQTSDGIEAKVLNLYVQDGDATVLPDLAYGSEAWAVLRLKIPKAFTGQGQGESHPLVRVSLTALSLEGQDLAIAPVTLELPSLPVQAFHAVSEDELVARRVGEVEAAGLQEEAQSAARRGDWKQVKRLLQDARGRAQDNPWVEAIVGNLETLAAQEDTERFSKEARYASRGMSSRIAALNESRDFAAGEPQPAMPSYLRRKKEQGKKES